MTIEQFYGPYRFLSNFWPCSVSLDGMVFPSVEHAYQAAKTLDTQARAALVHLTAGQAKRAGRRLVLRPDWDAVKLHVMTELVRAKFSEPTLHAALQATHPHDLVEGNTWGDTFWGVCNGVGANHLGQILMAVRKCSTSAPR